MGHISKVNLNGESRRGSRVQINHGWCQEFPDAETKVPVMRAKVVGLEPRSASERNH